MFNIALIGCGAMGITHLYCYAEMKDRVRIVAIAEGNAERFKAAKEVLGYDFTGYLSIDELLENEKPDMVDICLPTFLHCKYAVAAMEKGIKVLLEKPVCLKPEEAEIILETKKRTGVELQVAHAVRFFKEYAYVKKQIDSGKFGKVKSGTFWRFSGYPSWSPAITDYKKSGTVALDMHIHDVDYIRYLMGSEPEKVRSTASRNSQGVISHIFSTYEFGDAVISAESGWDLPESYPFTADFQVMAENAAFVYKDGVLTVYPEDGEPYVPDIEVKWTTTMKNNANLTEAEGYYLELAYFIDEVMIGGKKGVVDAEDAVKTFRLVMKEIDLCGGMKK